MTEILRQTVKALDHAHSLNIVHRDIKPENLFLQRAHDEEIVKVIDFGVAKQRGLPTTTKSSRSGALLGTPVYMSPEQIADRAYGGCQTHFWRGERPGGGIG